MDRFQDVRHLFDLPNLNPNKDQTLFGRKQTGDVWLLEAALLKSATLSQLATEAPISVPLEDLGASQELVTQQLGGKYRKASEEVRRPGEYRWVGEVLTQFTQDIARDGFVAVFRRLFGRRSPTTTSTPRQKVLDKRAKQPPRARRPLRFPKPGGIDAPRMCVVTPPREREFDR